MTDCIFCAIVSGGAPARMIDENAGAVAFLDIAPLTPGHTLVVPRRHSTDLITADPADLAAVVDLTRAVAPRVVSAVRATSFHVMSNTGADALQTVFHTHVHVIPRAPGDGFGVDLSGRGATVEQLDATHGAILGGDGSGP